MIRALALLAAAAPAAADTLPVKTYPRITFFEGDRRTVVATEGAATYTLVSAHKEAGRAWADALFERREEGETILVSRAYDCAAATYRWMGEAETYRALSLSVGSLDDLRDRPLVPGTIEHALARFVCAL